MTTLPKVIHVTVDGQVLGLLCIHGGIKQHSPLGFNTKKKQTITTCDYCLKLMRQTDFGTQRHFYTFLKTEGCSLYRNQ